MLRHINPALRLPDGRSAADIASEAEAEQIATELLSEAERIELQITADKEKQAIGKKIDIGWLYRARKAASARRETARAIKGALKVMRREGHQAREAARIAAGASETAEQKRERVRLANQQHETDCALFVAEMRKRLPQEDYLSVWAAVRAKKEAAA